MAANLYPIYPKTPDVDAVAITAANTSSQGGGTIGTDIFLLKTAPADGMIVRRIRFVPTATAQTATTATVARVFLSTQSSGATTSANTHLWAEVALASQTADSSTAAVSPIEIALDTPVPSGFSVLVTNHAAPAANTQWKAILIGSDY